MADDDFRQNDEVAEKEQEPRRTRGAAKKPRARKEPEGAVEQVAAAVTGAAVKAARTSRRTAASARRTVVAVPRASVKRAGEAVKSRTAANLGIAAVGVATGLAIALGRKALVQAPSTLSGDWFDAVKTEHKMALTLFDALAKTNDSDTAKRSTLLAQLKHALGKHAFMEENVLYPALRVKGDKADADKLNHDHGYVKQYLYDLGNMDKSSSEFLPKVAEFRREIAEHIDEEEQTIFPPLHAAMGADGNAKLTAQANKEAFKLA